MASGSVHINFDGFSPNLGGTALLDKVHSRASHHLAPKSRGTRYKGIECGDTGDTKDFASTDTRTAYSLYK